MLDFEVARNMQQRYNLPWTMWDDMIIVAQMRRIGINEIYSNDEDFDKIPQIKRIF
jgi:predicted nucleic acid-binding protein